ncbi:putative geraniol 8-hydroxylase [Iris pallida]|uniref:Geraniol 8-hydroxylase n=1 Tax=Iris pallida TaxID=29817 RepID=A0AAX6I992_IRIPA|nr:putative geraniol 8-hydroxylase [Iris pallida]KAJ6849447.1 putative geraniol 8-hydroxylase [Iris pallida]
MEKFIQQVITLLFLFLFSFFHELQPAVYDLVDHPEQPYEALGHLPPAAVWIDRREQREEIDEVRLADLLHDPRDNLLEAAARMIRMMIEGDQVRREGGGGDQIERGVEHRAPDVHRPARPPLTCEISSRTFCRRRPWLASSTLAAKEWVLITARRLLH